MSNEDRTYQDATDDIDFPDSGGATAVEEPVSPFKYYVEGERLREDGAFFELLLYRVTAQAGGVPEFDFVWPRAMKALAGLNTLRLSQFTETELSLALESAGPSFRDRLGSHVGHLVPWADAFWRICKIYGSFRQYLRSFDSEGHETLLADLSERLAGLSPEFLMSYLRAAGEKFQPPPRPDATGGNVRRPGQESGQQRRGRDGGGRRRSGRGNQQSGAQPKQSERTVAQTPASGPAPADSDKGQKTSSGRRRGRRGFFRRRRGNRGGGKSSDTTGASAPTAKG